MKHLIYILLIIGGTAGGAYVGYKVAQQKYENLINDELGKLNKDIPNTSSTAVTEPTSQPTNVVESLEENKIRYNKLAGMYKTDNSIVEKLKEESPKVYTISPTDFNNLDWEVIVYMVWADGAITKDNNYLVTKEEFLDDVGLDPLPYFGEYSQEPDAVHIENDTKHLLYEILLDERKYSDLKPSERCVKVDDEQ